MAQPREANQRVRHFGWYGHVARRGRRGPVRQRQLGYLRLLRCALLARVLLIELWRDWRADLERLPLTPPCRRAAPVRALRLTGIENGSVIRPAPGQTAAVVRVAAVGAREGLHWLLDGRLVGSGSVDSALRLKLNPAGRTRADGN